MLVDVQHFAEVHPTIAQLAQDMHKAPSSSCPLRTPPRCLLRSTSREADKPYRGNLDTLPWRSLSGCARRQGPSAPINACCLKTGLGRARNRRSALRHAAPDCFCLLLVIVRPSRLLVALLAVLVCTVALGAAAALPQAAAAASAPVFAYRGLGTWVDMYDARAWNNPTAAVKDMKAHGVRTLYLETANYHRPTDSSTIFRLPRRQAGRGRARAGHQGRRLVPARVQGSHQGLEAHQGGDRLPHSRRPEVRLVHPRHRGEHRQERGHAQHAAAAAQRAHPRLRRRQVPAGRLHPVSGRHGHAHQLLAAVPLQDPRRHLRRLRADGLLHLSR